MKLSRIIPFAAIVLGGLVFSCEKSMDTLDAQLLADGSASSVSNSDATLKSGKNGKNEDKGNKGKKDKDPIEIIGTVDLGVAGEFVILSKSGITDVYRSSINGDVGSSPITGAAIGLECNEVKGTIYSVDAAGPACKVTDASRLTTSVSDMETAYTDAAGRSNPDFLDLGAGNIGGQTLTPGLYKFTSAVVIPADITISGSSTDVWIFQIAGTLDMSSAVRITLEGGALASNIFWQTSGAVTLGTTSHFEGTILSQTAINLKTGASLNGRMLAQTEVTLQMNTVNQP